MCLSSAVVQTIKDSIAQWAQNAQVYLFGSRIDDNKRGDDIDLLIEAPSNIEVHAWIIA